MTTARPCFHCGLPSHHRFDAEINGKTEPFCCPGCKAVANLIHDSGLENFYQYRDKMPLRQPLFANNKDRGELTIDSNEFEIYNDSDYQSAFVEDAQNSQKTDPIIDGIKSTDHIESERLARIQIFGMNCSACAWLIEKRLEKFPDISSARINYSQHVLQVRWKPEGIQLSEIVKQIHSLGFDCTPVRDTTEQRTIERENQLFLRRIGVAGIGMMQVGMYAMAGYFGASNGALGVLRFAGLLIATVVIFYSAQPFFTGAWRALCNRHLSMDVPVSIALGLAYGASLIATWRSSELNINEVYFDAICMFSFFLLLSRYLEFKARSRWQNQNPEAENANRAHLISANGHYQQVPSSKLKIGQRILVKTGDMFPVDVLLTDGNSTISQAQLNGEFTPIKKHQGDEISSGSIQLSAPVEAEVLQTVNYSALSRIRSLVENAQMHKPAISSIADRISGYFVFSVLILATSTYLYWLQTDQKQAFWIALSVLVVSCPCALSLATPTALTVLMNHLRVRGILVKNPKALEKMDQIDHVIFDKTGTLTKGQFQIEQVFDFTGEGKQTHLQRAIALEAQSNHPLAQAFSANQHSIIEQAITIKNWRTDASKGVEAELGKESVRTRLGNKTYLNEICDTGLAENRLEKGTLSNPKEQAVSILYLGQNDELLSVFVIRDSVRPEAANLIEKLHSKLPSKLSSISLFSGDSSEQVDAIGHQLNISDVRKSMAAEEKFLAMEELQKSGEKVLAVGDGINDAPLLAAADVSIAVCNAIDLSKQTADFVLISDNLNAIDELFISAKKGKKIIQQNLSWALAYNLFAIPLAMMGLVPPWLAALGMSASSAVVVLNAFRAKSTISNPANNRPKGVFNYQTERYN